MILITGATGLNGSQIVKSLAAKKVACRALVRTPAKATDIKLPGVELVKGDFSDAASLDAAMQGVNHAFLMSSPAPDAVKMQSAFIAAAKRNRVGHVVKLSVIRADANAKGRFPRQHGEVEQVLKNCGLGWTMLQPTFFMQNLLLLAGMIKGGTIYQPAGDGKSPHVDVADITAVAVAVLTQPGHEGKSYVITGPEDLSYSDIAARFSKVLAKDVRYVNVTPDAAKQAMLGMGMPQWNVDGVLELMEALRNGEYSGVSNAVRDVTGRPPQALEQFIRENRQQFV